jgi:UDP-N-acetyl-D-galactosamine dehydrogenase
MGTMENKKIAIVGLGYVGLPLAIEFGKKINTIGYDINTLRVEELKNEKDSTLEVEKEEFFNSNKLKFTSEILDIKNCNVYIVTVPTPIDDHKQPVLTPLKEASKSIGKILDHGDIVIYESTVYPGATEEICVKILEKESQMTHATSTKKNYTPTEKHFYTGYSPERINPGDKQRHLSTIKKVTSGSTPEIADTIDKLYNLIISAGTYKASSIKVAEASKVIENTQRDLNIALINELALFFNKLDIDTEEVLMAAGTKWNFHSYRPGLVGGHCIGVDPYYLTYKASEVGYFPELILAGRRLNDNMGCYVADQISKLMTQKRIHVVDSNILIMGFTFKENCTDIRNTRIIDLVKRFQNLNCNVEVFDPWANEEEVLNEYNISILKTLKNNRYDAIIIAVSHDKIINMGVDKIRKLGKKKSHII